MNGEIPGINQENSTKNQEEEILLGGNEELIKNSGNRSSDSQEESLENLKRLQEYFGYTSFRPLQKKIISTILSKNNKRDICAALHPGYGKSLCYQYPAICKFGIVVVISSSIKKMREHTQFLEVVDVPACVLTHLTGHIEKIETQRKVSKGYYKIVYMTPEFPMLEKKLVEDWYSRVKLIAIDEAHCIIEDAKPFQYILRRKFPNSTWLCLSSAPSRKAQHKIIYSLELRKPLVVRSGCDRPNIYFEVRKRKPSFLASLSQFSPTNDWKGLLDESTTIYAADAQEADRIKEELEAAGVDCKSYRAGCPGHVLQQVSQEFGRDQTRVLVAVSGEAPCWRRPDVRRVIHSAPPSTLEEYWSEVGKAGRDGFPVTSLTFHEPGSEEAPRRPVSGPMREYLELNSCRRAFLLQYLDGTSMDVMEPQYDCCDVCRLKTIINQLDDKAELGLNDEGKYSVKNDCKALLGVMKSRPYKAHISKIFNDIETMSNFQRQQHHKNEKWWEEISNFLLKENYIEPYYIGENVKSYPSGVVPRGDAFYAKLIANSMGDIWMKPTVDMYRILIFSRHPEMMGYFDPPKQCFHTRRTEAVCKYFLDKRLKLATKYGRMPHVIISKMALRIIAELRPQDMEALRKLKLVGFSDKHIEKFGREFLMMPVSKKSLKEILVQYPLPCSAEDATKAVSNEISKTEMTKDAVNPRTCETLAARIRQGWQLKLSDFSITHTDRKMVAYVLFAHEHLFSSIIPRWRAAEDLNRFGELQMPVGHVLLTWSYLLVRKHLHYLQIHFEDFDPMPDFQQLLEKVGHLCTSEKQVEPCNTGKKQPPVALRPGNSERKQDYTLLVALSHLRRLNAQLGPPPVRNWSKLWPSCTDYTSVHKLARKHGIAIEDIWDMLVLFVRRGFPVVLSRFGVTEHVKWEVFTALLAHSERFLWADPSLRDAQEFRNRAQQLKSVPLEIIALTWSYLQVRIFLYHLQVEFEDFEPMVGLRRMVEFEGVPKFTVPKKYCSFESVLAKNALASYVPHKEWASLCILSCSSYEVDKVADEFGVDASVVWECISLGIRMGLEIKRTNFGITDAMSKAVATAFLKNTDKKFLWHVPTLPRAEQFRNLGRLNIETTKILLIWSYLQVRIHLHDLRETYEDFDQMKGLRNFLWQCENKRKRDKAAGQATKSNTDEGIPKHKRRKLSLTKEKHYWEEEEQKDIEHVLTADNFTGEEEQDDLHILES